MKFAGPLLVLIGAFVDDQRILRLPVLAIVVYWLWRCTWDVFYGPIRFNQSCLTLDEQTKGIVGL